MATDVQTLPDVQIINEDESFAEVSKKLASYIIGAVEHPLGWEDLRSSAHLKALQPLIDYLADNCHNVAVVAALVALKGHFSAMETDDDCGINESRGFACELVAWQFVLRLSDQDALDYLLYELKDEDDEDDDDEETGLLARHRRRHRHRHENGNGNGNGNGHGTNGDAATTLHNGNVQPKPSSGKGEGFAEPFMNLNTLEIAAVSGAKKFLMQRVVQDIVNGIWSGEIVFWDSLAVNAVKKPRYHNSNKAGADPWCRLRVPRYMKTFEIMFFVCFLALFYIVSLQREMYAVTVWELLFYVFVAGFAFDELDDFVQSGASFYSTDIWAIWDIGIVLIGVAFFVLRAIGLSTGHEDTLNWAFSILALHSLLLTPRIFSLLSLSPYYGSLLPCLKEMAKQFIRFLGFTLIIYLGFFSTFLLLARGHFPLDTLSITVLKVFFGAGVVGFDIAHKVSPHLGLPVMIVFVCLTNQLLITSMMAHISNSLRQVLESSREEYLFVYSVYVLESVTSDKLTYFHAPYNLIPVIFFKPLFWIIPEVSTQRIRILLLKATHAHLIVLIWLFERCETIALKRAANSLVGSDIFAEQPDGSAITGTATTTAAKGPANQKHSLKKGFVHVPTALLTSASQKKAAAATKQQQPARVVAVVPAAGAAEQGPAPVAAVVPGGAAQAVDAAGVAEMMRMLKELSAQVEEVRATLVKHDEGPPEV